MSVQLTPLESEVLEDFNYHCRRHERITITQLADECSVARSTISKLAGKLGYDGFTDMRETSLRETRGGISSSLLVENIVAGDLLDEATRLAGVFFESRDKKNLIHFSESLPESIVSPYVSRKLGMLDVFAPASYDYAQVTSTRREMGFALFFYHRYAGRYGKQIPDIDVDRPLVNLMQKKGLEIVVISDGAPQWLRDKAGLLIAIGTDSQPGIDLFIPKALMLVELALSELDELSEAAHGRPDETSPAQRQVLAGPTQDDGVSEEQGGGTLCRQDIDSLRQMSFL